MNAKTNQQLTDYQLRKKWTKNQQVFFFRMLLDPTCQTFIPHPYTFITLLSFHHCSSNRLYPYPFQAAHIQSKTKTFTFATPRPIEHQAFCLVQALGGLGKKQIHTSFVYCLILHAKHLYPTPIPLLLYYPFTIVLPTVFSLIRSGPHINLRDE